MTSEVFTLPQADRSELERHLRSGVGLHAKVRRSINILLSRASGASVRSVEAHHRVCRKTIARVEQVYAQGGVAGVLSYCPKEGRPETPPDICDRILALEKTAKSRKELAEASNTSLAVVFSVLRRHCRTRNTRRAGGGYSLVELVIAIVFLGICFAPFLMVTTQTQNLGSLVGQQGRREALRSWQDQVLVAGIDPALAPGLAPVKNQAVPAVGLVPVERPTVVPVVGMPLVKPLRSSPPVNAAENRPGGAGYELGAGQTAPVEVAAPAQPLPPILMQSPVLSPTNGSIVPVSAFSAGAVSLPYSLNIEARSTDGGSIHLNMTQPMLTEVGIGTVSVPATTIEFIEGIGGSVWAEYAGDPAKGDSAVTLPDGRIRWITHPSGRIQIYEPSPIESISYKLDLGAPVVLAYGIMEVASGLTLNLSYDDYVKVRDGTSSMRLDWSSETKKVFGASWSSVTSGFSWTFQDEPGPLSGDLASFFSASKASLWADTSVVKASPVLPSAAVAAEGIWTFSRQKIKLSPPELVDGGYYDGTTFVTGARQLKVPERNGKRVGRISAQTPQGEILSTTDTLDVIVAPQE